MTAATLITVSRIGMMFLAILLLYFGSSEWFVLAMLLAAAAVGLDALDGAVARKRGEDSSFGGIIDIAGDRIIENVMWIAFADLGVIDAWVPIVVVTRGVAVDALRAAAYTEGHTAFGPKTMMKHAFARWLTAGRGMRALFGTAKMFAFAFLAGMVGYQASDSASFPLYDLYSYDWFRGIGWVVTWLAVVLTLIRGLPVFIEALLGRPTFRKSKEPAVARVTLVERLERIDPDDVPAFPGTPS